MTGFAPTTTHGEQTTPVVDLLRRRRGSRVRRVAEGLAGRRLGVVVRRYGLVRCEEPIHVTDVVATSGDLAVADRLAFLAATEQRLSLLVVEWCGEYHACAVSREIDPGTLADVVTDLGAARIMSLVTSRGITPIVGPLGADVPDASITAI